MASSFLATIPLKAQSSTLKTSYFLDRMPMNNKLNPALINDYGYFAIPIVGGNFNVGVNSNLGLGNFFYPLASGKVGTFMHPQVNSSEFLDGLDDVNTIDQNLNLTILSTGFFGLGGYNTIDLSVKQNASFNFTKSLFEFIKNGQKGSSTTYNMGGTSVSASSYAELSFGHARKVTSNLTLGAKVKGLFGVGNVAFNIDRMDATLSDELWDIKMSGSGNIALLGSDINNDFEDFPPFGLGGFGLGLDLGATYENLVENLTISAAVTDLGFISWSKASDMKINGGTLFTGLEDIELDNMGDAFNDLTDDLTDDFEGMKPTFTPSSYNSYLNTSILVGAEYEFLPEKLSGGFLYTTTFGPRTITEAMLAVNFAPAEWFNMAVSGTVSNVGAYFGWVVNICPKFINIFVGMDRVCGSVSPQYIPINKANANFNFGISVPIGKKSDK